MTNRRDFLGLLAIAPIAAPAVAKELAAPNYASGGILSGTAGEFAPIAEFVVPRQAYESFLHALDNPKPPNEALMALMRQTSPWDVPNRLYGATINDEGDAI